MIHATYNSDGSVAHVWDSGGDWDVINGPRGGYFVDLTSLPHSFYLDPDGSQTGTRHYFPTADEALEAVALWKLRGPQI